MDDVEKIIRIGVPNTTMPAWGQFLSAEQIKDLARYLIVFSDKFMQSWKEDKPPGQLELSSVPDNLSSLVSQGKKLYDQGGCWNCHGHSGVGDGPSAASMADDWSNPIVPTDLTYQWTFKNGHEPQDIYRTLSGGLNGTPMPTYLDAFPNAQDRWALVAYVLSLSPAERKTLHLADFKVGVVAVSKRLDANGRVRK
jgi:cytochrome c oxidase cbb3-type subunit 2